MPNRVLELNERQRLFFKARRRFIGYGGARGGGKTWSVRMKAMLLASRYAGIKILIVRRSFQELRDNHILPLQMELRDHSPVEGAGEALYLPERLVHPLRLLLGGAGRAPVPGPGVRHHLYRRGYSAHGIPVPDLQGLPCAARTTSPSACTSPATPAELAMPG